LHIDVKYYCVDWCTSIPVLHLIAVPFFFLKRFSTSGSVLHRFEFLCCYWLDTEERFLLFFRICATVTVCCFRGKSSVLLLIFTFRLMLLLFTLKMGLSWLLLFCFCSIDKMHELNVSCFFASDFLDSDTTIDFVYEGVLECKNRLDTSSDSVGYCSSSHYSNCFSPDLFPILSTSSACSESAISAPNHSK